MVFLSSFQGWGPSFFGVVRTQALRASKASQEQDPQSGAFPNLKENDMSPLKHWQDAVSALLGVWLISSPWVLGFQAESVAMSNAVVAGIALLAVALGAIFIPAAWEEWTESALGLWLIISPWVLKIESLEWARISAVSTGVAVLVLALWVLMADEDYLGWFSGTQPR